MKNLLPLVFFLIILHYSCVKIESLPNEPHIEFKSFEIFDTLDNLLGNKGKGGKLKFYFEDGDGDIGLNPPASENLDTTNVVLTLFKKVDGIMQYSTDTLHIFRIPFIEKEGQNKMLKGTIELTFTYFFHPSTDHIYALTDTIKYDFYIIDRAANHSNTVSTNEIILSENRIY